jgi:hypothetical protein
MALHPVNEFLLRDFPWLKTDPDPIMGDSRPRTVAELLEKSNPVWRQLFQDFAGAVYPQYANGLSELGAEQARIEDYSTKLQSEYDKFYAAVGDLKTAVRKDPASVRTRFPWAPPDPRSLLGDARPKTFRELLDEGPGSRWYGVFKAYLVGVQHMGAADGFDWLVRVRSGSSWTRSLEPIVAAFADQIGRIKEQLHQKNDSSASQFARRARQVGEAMADHWVDKAEELAGRSPRYQPQAPQPQHSPPPGQQRQQDQPKPQTTQGQQGAQKPGTTTQAQQKPGTTTQGQQQRKTPAQQPQVKPDPVAAARKQLLTQVDICDRLAAMGIDVAQTANQLGHKYAALGGVFAQEATCLYAYFQTVSEASRSLQAQAVKSRSQSAAITTLGIFDALRNLRYAAYVLAWQLDLGYRTDAGKWPHDRIQAVLTAVDSAQCQALYQVAGQATGALCRPTWELYDKAREALDVAKLLVDHQTPGYDGQDGAVPWGVHEVMPALDGVNAVYTYAMQFAAQPPGDDVDETARDEAAQSCLGVTYDQFAAAVGSLV